MNIAFDDWIPVVTGAGKPKLVSLCEVLTQGEQYADLAVRPHERVALMRLFLCVAHAALDGPKDYDEWLDVPSRLPASAIQYLKTWNENDVFELFHPKKPWLQVADLNLMCSDKEDPNSDDEKGWTNAKRLCRTRASGENTTLFDHAASSSEICECAPHELALNLLAFQNYFVAGGKAPSRMWGKHEMKNPAYPRGGPCAGKSIIYTFLRGSSLAETIHLNLNSHENLKLFYGSSDEWLGRPIWEMPIESPVDQKSIVNATRTYLGRLVPQTRILRLSEDRRRVLLGAGFVYPKFQDEKNPFHPDSNATVVPNKDGERELLGAKASKSIWRELPALIVRSRNSSTSNRGPLCLGNIPDQAPCDIVVCAMITNPRQAAEIVDLVDSAFHIPAKLFECDGSQSYESGVKSADEFASRLGWAVEGYRLAIDGGWPRRLISAGPGKGELQVKLHTTATTHYWTAVEKNLPLLIAHVEAIGTENAIPTRDTWRKMLFAAACDAYRTACGQETPRQIRAFAEGWKRLLNQRTETESSEREDEA
jgi:CRISPR system Cascade subunit CasA